MAQDIGKTLQVWSCCRMSVFCVSSVGKESACYAGDPGSIPGSGSSPGEGIGYPLQYSWASLVAQLVKNACNVGDLDSIPRLGRAPGEGNGYPLQNSGPENSMDCVVHGVTESDTTEWLSLSAPCVRKLEAVYMRVSLEGSGAASQSHQLTDSNFIIPLRECYSTDTVAFKRRHFNIFCDIKILVEIQLSIYRKPVRLWKSMQ